MQRKKRNPRTLIFIAVMSVTMMIIATGLSMSFDSPLDVGWMDRYNKKPLNFDAIQEFLKAENIAFVTFVKGNGKVMISNAEGMEIRPCYDPTQKEIPFPGNCLALRGVTATGISQEAIIVTKGSPDCVTITTGGYAVDIDPVTRKPCKR